MNIDDGEKLGIDNPKQAPYIPPPYVYLTHDHINKMKVLELKIELMEWGWSQREAKSELGVCLKEAVDKNNTLVSYTFSNY